MKLKNYKSDADKIKEVAAQLKKVSQLYGFRLPQDPGIALELVKFICKDFSFIDSSNIEEAFKMASLDKLNVDIKSYGQILTIPMISKVIRAYRKAVSARAKKSKGTDKRNSEELNIMARLGLLADLEKPGAVIRFNHFDLITSYIEKIPAEVLQEAVQIEIEAHRKLLGDIQPQSKAQKISISQELNQIKSIATVKAKVRLATEYAASNIINMAEAESRIKAVTPIE